MLDLKNIQKIDTNTWFFRFKRFGEDYLITNDIAKHAFLTKSEFANFIAWKITEWEKYEELLAAKFIKDENYEKDLTFWMAKKNDFLDVWPSLHIIVVTLRCNHKCQYCHAAVAPMSAKEMDMTLDTAKKVVDTIFFTSNPGLTIEFQGWEALVNWDVVKYIVEYASIKALHLNKQVKFALVTNLTLMDDEKLDFLLKNDVDLTTSLDWDEETHNFNRTYKDDWNSYEEVIWWIKKINQEYKERKIMTPNGDDFKKIWALVTVTRKTLERGKQLIDTYVDLWMHWIFLRPLNPYGFAAVEKEMLAYTREEFIDFYKTSLDYILELNKKWIMFTEMLSSIYLAKIITEWDPNFLDERSPCWACIWQVAYNYDWKIYSCDEGRMFARMWDDSFLMWEVEESWENTYRKMLSSDTTRTMVQASTLDWLPGYNDSVYKPYIGVCPIHSYKESWNIIPNFRKDPKRVLDEAVLDILFDKIRNPETKDLFWKWLWMEWNLVTGQCEATH